MDTLTAYERAICEQIDYLKAELERIRAQRAAAAAAAVPHDESPMSYALGDPNFRLWLLQRQLEQGS